jgi:NTP pyrophosphatase (non-canonical NTP hydrolase)
VSSSEGIRIDRLSLTELQGRRESWAAANGLASTTEDMVDLMQEEFGEMANARVKLRQGIRRGATDRDALLAAERDAVGDLIITIAGYCTARGFSLQDVVEEAWNEVLQRDWKRYPFDGRTK